MPRHANSRRTILRFDTLEGRETPALAMPLCEWSPPLPGIATSIGNSVASTEFRQTQLELSAGERIEASSSIGVIRVLNADGQLLFDTSATGQFNGGQLAFQAPQRGTYVLEHSASSTDFSVRRAIDSLAPEIVGAAFRILADDVAFGERIPFQFTLQNRGGADAGAFRVQIWLADSTATLAPIREHLLTTVDLAGLKAGFSAVFASSGVIPAEWSNFARSGRLVVKLRIDPDGALTSNPSALLNQRGGSWQFVRAFIDQPQAEPNNSLGQASPLVGSVRVQGQLSDINPLDVYRIETDIAGRVAVRLRPSDGGRLRLELLDRDGRRLAVSDQAIPQLVQHLDPAVAGGPFYLRITSLTGNANYSLTSEWDATSVLIRPPVLAPIQLQNSLSRPPAPFRLIRADLNRDGLDDLITVDRDGIIRTALGLGDGMFAAEQVTHLAGSISAAEYGHFGRATPELAVILDGELKYVPIDTDGRPIAPELLSFEGIFLPRSKSVNTPWVDPIVALAVGDTDGDGIDDIAIARGRFVNVQGSQFGNVTLVATDRVRQLAFAPTGLTPSLAILTDQQLGLWRLNHGLVGWFDVPEFGQFTWGDVEGDRSGEIIVVGEKDGVDELVVLRADGKPIAGLPLPSGAGQIQLLDLNRDGQSELLLSLPKLRSALLLPFVGAQPGVPVSFRLPNTPVDLGVGRFNAHSRPGQLDLAVLLEDGTTAILLGRGDGRVQLPRTLGVGELPVALESGDINGDGLRDLLCLNGDSSDLSLLYGMGDGMFRPERRVALPGASGPLRMALGEFGGDGRKDLIVLDRSGLFFVNNLELPDAIGERFPIESPLSNLPSSPVDLQAIDWNGDGKRDLAILSAGEIHVFLNLGARNFAEPIRYAIPTMKPVRLQTLRTAGSTSLLALDASGLLTVLGRDGSQTNVQAFDYMGDGPYALTMSVGDLNGDGQPEVAVLSTASTDNVRVMSLVPGGLSPSNLLSVPTGLDIAAGDFGLAIATDAGNLAIIDPAGQRSTVEMGLTSAKTQRLLVTDIDQDGTSDLITGNAGTSGLSVFLNRGKQLVPSELVSAPNRSTPVMTDLFGVGKAGLLNLAANGQLLWHDARPNSPDRFAPPRVINPAPQQAVQSFTSLTTNGQPRIAVIERENNQLVLYRPNGRDFERLPTGLHLPGASLLKSGDLDGDGISELLVLSANPQGQLTVLRLDVNDRFRVVGSVALGANPIDLTVLDIDGDGRREVAINNRASSDVSLVRWEFSGNSSSKSGVTSMRFSEFRYRISSGPYSLDTFGTAAKSAIFPRSDAASYGVVAGRFSAAGMSILVSDSLGNRLTELGTTGFGVDATETRVFTAQTPTAMTVADFDGNGYDDVAVLNPENGTASVYLSSASGQLRLVSADIAVGSAAVGIASEDIDGDGMLDLLVADASGTVLLLKGNGDGTFAPFFRPNRDVSLVVANLNGRAGSEVILINRSLDTLIVRDENNQIIFRSGRADGLNAPADVDVADFDGDGNLDLLVVNEAANNVLFYAGRNDGTFAQPLAFSVSLAPVSLTIGDVNGDGIFDAVVANKGSNDLSVLLGVQSANGFLFVDGPRIPTGTAPTSVALFTPTGKRLPNLVVSNSGDNSVWLLPALGDGRFDHVTPQIFPTGPTPEQLLLGDFDGLTGLDLIVLNIGGNSLTFFSDFQSPNAIPMTIPTGGQNPSALIATAFADSVTSNLIVAHNGDNMISLIGFDGGTPELIDVQPGPNQFYTDIALSSIGGKSLTVLLAWEGADVTSSLSFNLSDNILPPTVPLFPSIPSVSPGLNGVGPDVTDSAVVTVTFPSFPDNAMLTGEVSRGQITDLIARSEDALTTTATLLTITATNIEAPSEAPQSSGLATLSLDAVGLAPLNPTPLGSDEELLALDLVGESEREDQPARTRLARFLLNTSNALNEHQAEVIENLHPPAPPAAMPEPTNPERVSATETTIPEPQAIDQQEDMAIYSKSVTTNPANLLQLFLSWVAISFRLSSRAVQALEQQLTKKKRGKRNLPL